MSGASSDIKLCFDAIYIRLSQWINFSIEILPNTIIKTAAIVMHLVSCIRVSLCCNTEKLSRHGPLDRYVQFQVAHAPGMPGTFSPPPRVSDPDMHHGTCVTHVPWCMPGLLTSGFLWSRWRGKRSRHSRRMRNPQFYVYGKRPIACSSEII